MYDTVEFRHLKYFVAVAEEGNFSRAAERLHVAQPSLSAQMKQFEELIPAQLFVRESFGIKLTPAGEAFLPSAKQILRNRDQALAAAHAIGSGKAPPLELGYSLFIDHELVETAVRSYRRLFPDSKVVPTSDCTGRLVELLSDGRLQAALLALPIEGRGLTVQPIAAERLLVCMRKDDPQAAEPAIPLTRLASRLQISFDPKYHSAFYNHLRGLIGRTGIQFEPTRFASAPSEIQWLVKRGWGHALVPESMALDSELVAKPIDGMELKIEWAFAYRSGSCQPALQLLAAALKNRAQNAGFKKPPKRVRIPGGQEDSEQLSLL